METRLRKAGEEFMGNVSFIFKKCLPLLGTLMFIIIIHACVMIFMNNGFAGMVNSAVSFDSSNVIKYSLISASAAFLTLPLNFLEGLLTGYMAEKIGYRIRIDTASHMLKTRFDHLDQNNSGDSISRINNDLSNIIDFIRNNLKQIMIDMFFFIIIIGYLLFISWKLTIGSFVIVPLLMWFSVKKSKPIKQHSQKKQEALSDVNSLAKGVIDSFQTIKVFSLENIMQRKYDEAVDTSVRCALRVNKLEAVLLSLSGLFNFIPLGILLGLGGFLVIRNEMAIGTLYAYINISNFVINPVMNFSIHIAGIRSFSANCSRIKEVFNQKTENIEVDSMHRQVLKTLHLNSRSDNKAIKFSHVSFSYKNDIQVLKDVTFEIPCGCKTALVGPSGCGKSTILKLLAGFYQPQEGDIEIFDTNIIQWNLNELRKNMAVVTQDTFMFPGSIYENITYGHEMPYEKVIEICKAANIYEYIKSLPDGVYSESGEKGVKMSGGQRQRIAIARALAKDAPIVMLDEATSALDSETERGIQEAMERLMKGRTVLTVTHRLSTIRNADLILCMDEGRVIEAGKHEELVRRNGFYSRLYKYHLGDVVEWSDFFARGEKNA